MFVYDVMDIDAMDRSRVPNIKSRHFKTTSISTIEETHSHARVAHVESMAKT